NLTGQLGDSTTTASSVPVKITNDTDWEEISCGYEYSLARKADSTIWSWGFNGNGQLGLGGTAQRNFPNRIGNASYWREIEAGATFAFAINSSNQLYCWGYNQYGQLGLGNTSQQNVPVQVGEESNYTSISGASGAASGNSVFGGHSAAIQAPNYSLCTTGANYIGQLGNGSETPSEYFVCETGELNTGISAHLNDNQFLIFPNPSSGLISIQIDDETNIKGICTITNMLGQTMYHQRFTSDRFDIDLHHLNPGIYHITLQSGRSSLSSRLVLE
ncbi:MAG: T9SS type A sorting domain-containing protein, partial [Bacteroidia bacterium]